MLHSNPRQFAAPRRGVLTASHLAAFLSLYAVASAQTGPASTPTPTPKNDEIVHLEPYEVMMTEDKGYFSPYSGSALKTNEEIMKVPQSITVLTRDLMDDIANFQNLSDMLNYVGVGNFQQGDSAYIRGNNAPVNTDGAGDGSPSMAPDSSTIDSITIIRGPIAVLYGGNSSLTGAIVRQTRIPLDRRQTTLKAQIDDYGFHRTELDHTGPLGKLGEAKFSYRVDFTQQGGKTFLRNVEDLRQVYFGVVQMKYKNTTLRLNTQFQDTRKPYYQNNFMTPDGTPWLGAGRDESFQPKGSLVRLSVSQIRLAWTQHISRAWSLNAYGTISHYRAGPQSEVIMTNVDFKREVFTIGARRNNGGVDTYTTGADLNGVYKVLGRELRTSLGFNAWTSARWPYDFILNPDFGSQNAALGTPAKSAASALGFDRLVVPFAQTRYVMDHLVNIPASDYRIAPTTTLGTRVVTTERTGYAQQNIELIPNRLIVMGALSEIKNNGTSRSYSLSSNGTATENRNQRTLHRFGVVLNLSKSIALYAVETTNVVFLNSTSRLENGSFIPPRDGVMREAGIKTAFFDNRIDFTTAIYTTYFNNYAVSRTGGITPGFTYNVFDLIRDSYIKGWDFSLNARIVSNWQLMVNFTEQDPRIQATNTRLPASNRGSWGVFTSYQFTSEPLKRFRIGAGANRFKDRITAASQMTLPSGVLASTLYPGGQLPLKNGTMTTAFVECRINRQLSVKLNVNNVLNETFILGAQNAVAIDPSQPRTFSLIGTLRF